MAERTCLDAGGGELRAEETRVARSGLANEIILLFDRGQVANSCRNEADFGFDCFGVPAAASLLPIDAAEVTEM